MDRNSIVGVLFFNFLPQILENFICSIDSPRRPEYAHKFLGKSYRPNKSYETSKFSMMVTYNAIEYEQLVDKLELKRKCCEEKIKNFICSIGSPRRPEYAYKF